MFLGPTAEIVFLGKPENADTSATLLELRGRFIPNKVVALRSGIGAASDLRSKALDPLFEGKAPLADEPTLFVCENFACQAPISGPAAIAAKLDELANR
jgi:uncharacterized protein